MTNDLCQFRAHNIKTNKIAYIQYEYINGKYYWINSKGDKAAEFNSKSMIISDAKEMYGSWYDFKILI